MNVERIVESFTANSELDRKIAELTNKIELFENAKDPGDFYDGYLDGLKYGIEKLNQIKVDSQDKEFVELMITGLTNLCNYTNGKLKGMIEAQVSLKKYLEELNGSL